MLSIKSHMFVAAKQLRQILAEVWLDCCKQEGGAGMVCNGAVSSCVFHREPVFTPPVGQACASSLE
eukprot:m.361561 g.361561  ORF g.361561 m.361561 type:complete len:66 (-) comp20779_c0_seq17:2231-2428(-)